MKTIIFFAVIMICSSIVADEGKVLLSDIELILRDSPNNIDNIISIEELKHFIPSDLIYYTILGKVHHRNKFRVRVLPLADSAQIMADTTSTSPKYLLALFDDLGTSYLVLLKQVSSEYEIAWSSDAQEGVGGFLLQDINGDGDKEIMVSLLHSYRVNENIFIFLWNDGVIKSMLPSGKSGGMSEISGRIHFEASDSGMVIITSPPDHRKRESKTFFIKKDAKVIKLVEEKKREEK